MHVYTRTHLEQSGELDATNTEALQGIPEADDVSFQENKNKTKMTNSLGKESSPITPLSAAYALPEARHKLKTLLQATGSYVRGTDSIEVSDRVANGFVFKLESVRGRCEDTSSSTILEEVLGRLYNHVSL
jgi:hypothetical protein